MSLCLYARSQCQEAVHWRDNLSEGQPLHYWSCKQGTKKPRIPIWEKAPSKHWSLSEHFLKLGKHHLHVFSSWNPSRKGLCADGFAGAAGTEAALPEEGAGGGFSSSVYTWNIKSNNNKHWRQPSWGVGGLSNVLFCYIQNIQMFKSWY